MTDTDTADTTPKYRTITLTDRAPVRIRDDRWEVIASGLWFEGQYDFQANRSDWLKVRQHADGRTLVYGGYNTKYQGGTSLRGGELLAKGADIAAAINRVAETIGAQCAAECIANLPAEDLDDKPGGTGTVTRTGTLPGRDATLSHYRTLLVRELNDGSVEYFVIAVASRMHDGWVTLPPDLLPRVTWD